MFSLLAGLTVHAEEGLSETPLRRRRRRRAPATPASLRFEEQRAQRQ